MNAPSWITPRYMSIMYIVPSGALYMLTGRNRSSVDAINSFLSYAFCEVLIPWSSMMSCRRTRNEDVPLQLRRQVVPAINHRPAVGVGLDHRPVRPQKRRQISSVDPRI